MAARNSPITRVTRPFQECYRVTTTWSSLGPIDTSTNIQIGVVSKAGPLQSLVVNLALIERFVEGTAQVYEDCPLVCFVAESTRMMGGPPGLGTNNPVIFKAAIYSFIAARLWNKVSGGTVNKEFVQTLTNAHRASRLSYVFCESSELDGVRDRGLDVAIRIMLNLVQYYIKPHPEWRGTDTDVSKFDELAGLLYRALHLSFSSEMGTKTWAAFIKSIRALIHGELAVVCGSVIVAVKRYPCMDVVSSLGDHAIVELSKRYNLISEGSARCIPTLRDRLRRISKRTNILNCALMAKFMWDARSILITADGRGSLPLEDVSQELDSGYKNQLGTSRDDSYKRNMCSSETAQKSAVSECMIEALVSSETVPFIESKIMSLCSKIDASGAFV